MKYDPASMGWAHDDRIIIYDMIIRFPTLFPFRFQSYASEINHHSEEEHPEKSLTTFFAAVTRATF